MIKIIDNTNEEIQRQLALLESDEIDLLLESAALLLSNHRNLAHFSDTVEQLNELLGNSSDEALSSISSNTISELIDSMNELIETMAINHD